ncbi:M55 family metallopeptidase [Pacificimonas sp. ICDLI1SI03]
MTAISDHLGGHAAMGSRFGAAIRRLGTAFLLMFALSAAPAAAQQDGYRIYISVDMEGLAGAVTPNQIIDDGNEYNEFRQIMLGELLAAISGAREAGATEFVISDSHGSLQNIPLEGLPEDVLIIRGEPRPLSMVEGIDNGEYDGAMFIGYHASASNMEGVRAHTFSSARLSEVKLNGVPASEGYINAAVAGQFDVPVILITGDDATIKELEAVGAEGVAVKRAIGFHAAETLTPAAARKQIQAAARRAVGQIDSYRPFKVDTPAIMDVTFHYYRPAEVLSWLPQVERSGARSVRFEGETPADALKLLEFALSYSIDLTP